MIIGAGLTGLIAAHIFPRVPLAEAAPQPTANHRAVLRFRSDVVSNLTGIPFRAVTVRKGIYYNRKFCAPSIDLANLYSQKCLGKIIGERSIWNIEAATRFIAPEDFYEQLVDQVGVRIAWNAQVDIASMDRTFPVISTIPLPVTLAAVGIEHEGAQFEREAITVRRFRVHECDAYQTVYFPSYEHSLYRASITGDLLICEFVGEPDGDWETELNAAFQIGGEYSAIDTTEQKYGKIAPIDNGLRKQLIHRLTRDYNIFSLGRFAIWKNVLLDEIVKDANIIKRLSYASGYDRKLASV